jgi:hypothetical protein
MWLRWCNDNGLMLYCRSWHTLGWTRGVIYACRVPYWPSIDLIFSSNCVVLGWHL